MFRFCIFFFPSIFLLPLPLVLGLSEVQRWWARPSPFIKHFNFGILLFQWQANCPTPVHPGGPWYHVQVPALKDSGWCHRLPLLFHLSGFSLRIQNSLSGFLFSLLHPRTNFSTWSTLVKNKNTLTGLTFWWRETDNKTKGTKGERYAADPRETQSRMCTQLYSLLSVSAIPRMCQFN